MPKFLYRAQPKERSESPPVEATVEAESSESLKRKLEEVGFHILQILEVADLPSSPPNSEESKPEETLAEIIEKVNETGISRLANALLQQALQERATDLYLEPQKEGGLLRIRVEGELREIARLPSSIFTPLIARLKLMAEMDFNDRENPQKGTLHARYQGKAYQFSVSTLPTRSGESVSLRVIDTSMMERCTWDRVGFSTEEELRRLADPPQGLYLFAGPWGSGKTTVMYGFLQGLDTERLSAVTVAEDSPFRMKGVYHSRFEIPIEQAISALVERDTDILAIGLMEESKTIRAALDAARMGRMVLSVFQAADIADTLARLISLGASPDALAENLKLIAVSRLVRKICPHCKTPYRPEERDLRALGLTPEEIKTTTFYRGAGCEECRGSGVLGRIALFEWLSFEPEWTRSILAAADPVSLRRNLIRRGYRTHPEEAVRRFKAGEIPLEEALAIIDLKGEGRK